MLRWTLIVAAGCVLLIAVMALTRNMGRPAPATVDVAEPAVVLPRDVETAPAKAPEPKVGLPTAPAEAMPADQQVEDDAAAVGMTTREPEADASAEPSP